MTTAVLVIDVQQGLCVGENAAFACADVISRINVVTSAARFAKVPVFWVQHQDDELLVYGSESWQLADGLKTQPDDQTLLKRTPDSFHDTGLQQNLAKLSVDHLVICGMHTEFCIDTSIRRALALGFSVTLIEDAHTSAGNRYLSATQVIGHHNETLRNISSFGVRVTTVPAALISFESPAVANLP